MQFKKKVDSPSSQDRKEERKVLKSIIRDLEIKVEIKNEEIDRLKEALDKLRSR